MTRAEREQTICHAFTHAPENIAAPACEALESLLGDSRDLREILRAWGLGQTDKMNAVMLGAFLREFGKAPPPEPAAQPQEAPAKAAGAPDGEEEA